MRARRAMAFAHALAADGARPTLVRREQHPRLIRASPAVPRTHQPLRRVGAAQVRRAVHLPIHDADGLMRRADGLAAARALRDLVHAYRLVRAPLTVPQARRAQVTAALRRLRVAPLRVPVAHDPPAAGAWREAGGTRRMPFSLAAGALVCRAMLEPARRAHAYVLVTRRLRIHPTLGDAVVHAEVLAADRAAVGARLAGAVVVAADHQERRRAAAVRARHDPGGRTGRAQGPLGAERGATLAGRGRLELPLGALQQDGGLDELQGVHDGLHLTAPDLLGPPPLGERGDGGNGLRVGLLFENRLEVAVQPSELGSELPLRHGAARGDALGRLVPEVGQQQPEQLRGLPRGNARRVGGHGRIRGGAPARLEVPERGREIVAHL